MAIDTLTATRCVLADLVPGGCAGGIDWHHVYPVSAGGDPEGRTVPVCDRHHPMLESVARRILRGPRRCSHYHPTREGREVCERRLNSD